MKATGIVRRIDDLGRVVIPKEIRRVLRIREGDPLEIYTDNNGEVIFKKYSPIGDLAGVAADYAEVLSKACGYPVIVCDSDHVIAVSGMPKKEILERRISTQLEDLQENRRSFLYASRDDQKLMPVEGVDRHALASSPILVAGDIYGTISILASEPNSVAADSDNKLVLVAANFLAKQMEE